MSNNKSFGSKDPFNQLWNKKKLYHGYGHNTENYNIQVTTKIISKSQSVKVVSQTVTVNGKTEQTLFANHSDKKKKK